MDTKNLLDVKKVIESRTYVTSLKDLERKGKTKLKVVKADEIYGLISQAVENVVQEHSLALAEQEKAKIVEDSKQEFQGLVKERQEEKKRAELQEKLIQNMEQELSDTGNQLQQLREQVAQNQDGQRTKEERIQALETELAEERKEKELLRNRLEAEKSEAQNTYMNQMSELKNLIQDRSLEDRLVQEQQRMQNQYEEQIATLKGELTNVRESMNYSDSFSSLLTEVKTLKSSISDLDKDRGVKVDEKFIQEQLAPMLNKEEKINSRIEKLFAEKMEKLSDKISQRIAGLSVMGGNIVEGSESKEAAKLVLENLFNEELSLESNLGNIGTKEKTGGGILGNLAKLKALRMNKKDKKEEEQGQ